MGSFLSEKPNKKESKYMGVNVNITNKSRTFVTQKSGEEFTPEEYGDKMGLNIKERKMPTIKAKQNVKREQKNCDFTPAELKSLYPKTEGEGKGDRKAEKTSTSKKN